MAREYDLIIAGSLEWQLSELFFSNALLSDPYKLMFLPCHIRVSEWIHILWLPECQGTPCSKQVQNQILIKFLWIHEISQIANRLVEQNFIFLTMFDKDLQKFAKMLIFYWVIRLASLTSLLRPFRTYFYHYYYYCHYYYYYYCLLLLLFRHYTLISWYKCKIPSKSLFYAKFSNWMTISSQNVNYE